MIIKCEITHFLPLTITDILNFLYSIRKLHEAGMIKKFYAKHWPEDTCSLKQAEAEKPRAMTLRDVTGVFIILCTGLIISHLVLALELVVNYTKQRRDHDIREIKNSGIKEIDDVFQRLDTDTSRQRDKTKGSFQVLGQLATKPYKASIDLH